MSFKTSSFSSKSHVLGVSLTEDVVGEAYDEGRGISGRGENLGDAHIHNSLDTVHELHACISHGIFVYS